QDRQNCPEEIRHRDEQKLREGQHAIRHGALMGGCSDAERDADGRDQNEADGGKDRRSAECVEYHRTCWPIHRQRLAEVAVQHGRRPAPVLHGERIIQAKLGLNDPLAMQYWRWATAMLHGDFGQSLTMDRPAGPVIFDALGRSAILAAISFILVATIGITLGIRAATHKGAMSDRVLTFAQFLFIAVPDFFWAILAILLFAS